MKWFILLFVFAMPVSAGTVVDNDKDGLSCIMEDDGLHCGEDDQDLCDFIPNVSRDDGHCSVDFNDDGLFTIADVRLIQAQFDHFLSGIPYPNYVELGVPRNFGGFGCFDIMRVIKYNNDLFMAGLPLLQMNLPFIVLTEGIHCGLDHHSYPPIL